MTVKHLLVLLAVVFIDCSVEASTQAHHMQTVQRAPTVTTVQAPTGTIFPLGSIPLIIHVRAGDGTDGPNGIATLSFDGAPTPAAQVVNGLATAVTSIGTLGIHLVSACYSGSDNFLPSCSPSVPVTAVAPYVLQQESPLGAATPYTSFTSNLDVISAAGFAGSVQVICASDGGECSVSPATLIFSGNSETKAVKVSFTPTTPAAVSGVIMAPLMAFSALSRRKGRRGVKKLFLLFGGTLVLFGATGCHALSYAIVPWSSSLYVTATSQAYTQAVTYQITINP
jgi:hypothetical protein